MSLVANLPAMAYNGVVVDLDGTVYRGDRLISGAGQGIEGLREAGCSTLFVSNNPTRSGDEYVQRLSHLGIPAQPGDALSAGDATVEYLRENHSSDAVMLVGAPGLREQLLAADISLTEDATETDVLVGSWTPEFEYRDMNAALQAVDGNTPFLGTDPDRTFPREDDREEPGSGAIIGALAETVGRDPDAILGKPSAYMADLVTQRLGADPEECLVVGDRLGTDLLLGERVGMTTVLVLSGVTDRSDVEVSDLAPDYVLDSLAEVETVLADC
jgi:HAD superfamily hydrolase (TIGR01450 family)